jgi:CRP/FNR family transcriptional regulator, nitrogen oxide reductase regulator
VEDRRRVPLTVPTAGPHACPPDVRIQVLGKVPFFAGLDHDELHQVDDRCRVRGLTAGEPLYLEGQPAGNFYVVATGILKTTRLNPDGRETMFDLLVPGDFLGTYPTQGVDHYLDSAWAVTPACVLVLDSRDFTAILQRFPAVTLATLSAVSARLSQAQDAVHRLSAAPVEQRLAATLLLIADKTGDPWQGGTLLQVPLSREDLASMIGARTETVSRVLSAWRADGLIETGRRWVAIKDVPGLQALRDAA